MGFGDSELLKEELILMGEASLELPIYLLCLHHLQEILEEVGVISRIRGGFGVVMDARDGKFLMV
ncbi:hypothetical protein ACFLT8_01340 [Chloroflexota bacterium]